MENCEKTYDDFVHNILSRRIENQYKALGIYKSYFEKYLGIIHPFNTDLLIEMSHYQNNEFTTEQFGEYLKLKRIEFLKLINTLK